VTVTGVQLLRNTGFETGTATPWSISPAVLQDNSSLAHTGNWYADIGKGFITDQKVIDHVSQAVTIPNGNTSAALTFDMHITTSYSGSPTDRLDVKVYDASGTFLATLATYWNTDATSDYVQHNLDMTPYIGQKVTIKFLGMNTGFTPTHWLLDDVTLTAQ